MTSNHIMRTRNMNDDQQNGRTKSAASMILNFNVSSESESTVLIISVNKLFRTDRTDVQRDRNPDLRIQFWHWEFVTDLPYVGYVNWIGMVKYSVWVDTSACSQAAWIIGLISSNETMENTKSVSKCIVVTDAIRFPQ